MRKQLLLMLTFLLYAAGMMAQPDWGYNPNAYSDEHVVYACLVDADGLQVGGQFTYVGAFIDGECRGLVRSEFGTSGSRPHRYAPPLIRPPARCASRVL